MKYVYFFGEGDKSMKELLGGKGANLTEMTTVGIPVPPGFVITTEVCKKFNEKGFTDEVKKEILDNIKKLEEKIGKKFGDANNPLLVSVRSGAAVSMPGMMDTVLNLGMNDVTVKALGNNRFAYDSYRRFIQMFGNVVLGIDGLNFEKVLDRIKIENNLNDDTELSVENLKIIVKEFSDIVTKESGKPFPQDPIEQLWKSIEAVFKSWNNPRAIKYRELNDIKGLKGTAVNVQAMVFGNMGDDCSTGVCFTRNPSTGENKFYGEYLINAQGEDVVAGIRTPEPIENMEKTLPDAYKDLLDVRKKLEEHFKDMQDMEFTVENKKLYILQTRNGKRTGIAAVKIAVDMVKEGLISIDEAILRVDPNQLNQLLHPTINGGNYKVLAKGLPASPGAAVGQIVFDAKTATEWKKKGKDVILVRIETSPEDIEGMDSAKGILTARGGMTSHAAVVARGMGKCCVAGCGDLVISESEVKIKNTVLKEGDYISLDGTNGYVIQGKVELQDPELAGEFKILMTWADQKRKLGVRTNADTPKDAKIAKEFGAEGIGLCRTEHMFFEGERIKAMRQMILSSTIEEREKALEKLFPYQLKDFEGLFEAMDGMPVTIRLLDPPLHEFLPEGEELAMLAKEANVGIEYLNRISESLKELNPMLGHRGCRLAITYPEIYNMQTRAIITAALNVKKKGINVQPQIMVPLIGYSNELKIIKNSIINEINIIFEKQQEKIDYKIGTMIEVPRAAIVADKIAKDAEFFSFGTNDLTQMTLGYSRDDAGKFIPEYLEKDVYPYDPFQVIDETGVGELIKIAVEKGKKSRPDISLGICGEHGGEPKSINFAHRVGLKYVSCSPFRVPIARLAAAQAAIRNDRN